MIGADSRYATCVLYVDGDREFIGTRQRIDTSPRPDDVFHTVIEGDRIDLNASPYKTYSTAARSRRFYRLFGIQVTVPVTTGTLACAMTAEREPIVGAFEADAWAGLVVGLAPGRGAALRLLVERDGERLEPRDLFLRVHEELPYDSAVRPEQYLERKDGSVEIHQQIVVGRDNQRAIVLGKGGSRIKAIGEAARAELSELLGRKVHLFLHVKVSENWAEDKELFEEIGLDWVR